MAIPIVKKNKKFWEELIAYYPFTEILVLDTRRKKASLYLRNEVNKQRCITDWSDI
jgi:hypothetical protein